MEVPSVSYSESRPAVCRSYSAVMSVVIAGAGPTGAALALLLTERGVSVLLVERELSFERVFRGEALMPGGLKALRQMGVGPALERLPHQIIPCMELFVDGSRVVRADWPEVSRDNAAWAISQPALIALLVGRAAETGLFELRMGTTLDAIEQTDTHVDVTVRSAEGTERIRASAVIGADGRSSRVRSIAGIKLERQPFPGDVAWLSVPAPDSQRADPRFQAFSHPGGALVLYPSWDGSHVRVGVNLAAQDVARSKASLLERVATIAGEPYAGIVRESAAAVADPVMLKVLVGRVPRWSDGRLLLLGDAAHPMAPVRAQGVNLALRDAIVAANHLVPALRQGTLDALVKAGARIQQDREPEVATIQRLQLEAMILPPVLRSPALRRTVFPVLRRAGIIKKMMLRSELLFRHGTTDVQLIDGG